MPRQGPCHTECHMTLPSVAHSSPVISHFTTTPHNVTRHVTAHYITPYRDTYHNTIQKATSHYSQKCTASCNCTPRHTPTTPYHTTICLASHLGVLHRSLSIIHSTPPFAASHHVTPYYTPPHTIPCRASCYSINAIPTKCHAMPCHALHNLIPLHRPYHAKWHMTLPTEPYKFK
jgi:hypothetical protein